MKNKKAVINQIFVYIMSTIVVVFVGFLVVKFIIAFTADSEDVILEKFYTTLENDIKQVSSRYGSEELYDYKITQKVVNVCFIPDSSCSQSLITPNDLPIESTEIQALSQNSNFLIFDKEGIISTRILKEYNSVPECFCIKTDFGKFSLLIENKKNKIWISQYLK